jgi:glycosyltransferase involved in cell wall biosynthesis
MIKYSVVIPVYNEEESLALLFASIKNVMDKLNCAWEVIFVNDHSKDNSLQTLKNIDTQGRRLLIVDLKKHYGQSVSLQSGFDNAQGEIIITMDGDLQNDPEDIPKLLGKLEEGFDVVCGWRYPRKDPRFKIWSAKIAYAVRKVINKENIHDVGCTLRVLKKESLNSVYLSGGLHRFFSLIMLKLGYKIGEVKVRHQERRFGKTKYNIRNRLFQGLKDLIRIKIYGIKALMTPSTTYEIREIIRR